MTIDVVRSKKEIKPHFFSWYYFVLVAQLHKYLNRKLSH
jgi:hypothetical protein